MKGAGPFDDVLMISLQAAVSLRILELNARALEFDIEPLIRRWAAEAVEPIASRGDALQFGGKRGAAADVFNHLACGLAALAFSPGGVVFGGYHWCARVHQYGKRVASAPDLVVLDCQTLAAAVLPAGKPATLPAANVTTEPGWRRWENLFPRPELL